MCLPVSRHNAKDVDSKFDAKAFASLRRFHQLGMPDRNRAVTVSTTFRSDALHLNMPCIQPVSKTGNDSSNDQLSNRVGRTLESSADDHYGTSSHNRLPSTEILANEQADDCSRETPNIVYCDYGTLKRGAAMSTIRCILGRATLVSMSTQECGLGLTI